MADLTKFVDIVKSENENKFNSILLEELTRLGSRFNDYNIKRPQQGNSKYFGKEQINKNVNIFDLLYDFGDFKNNNMPQSLIDHGNIAIKVLKEQCDGYNKIAGQALENLINSI